jgi:nitrogen-specific signal transduction histidine kinase
LVYSTNPSRSQNGAFLLLTIILSCWNLTVIGAVLSNTPEQGALMIRLATVATAFVPVGFHILCIAITHPDFRSIYYLKRARWTILACLSAGLLSFTSFYMRSATLAESSSIGTRTLPQPIYGPGFTAFCLIHFIISTFIFVLFVRAFRAASGSRRNELHFVILGVGVMTLSALFIAIILPMIYGTTDVQLFGPLSITGMNCIIAYGIATKRIMDVADALRTSTSYLLLAGYLCTVYVFIWLATNVINEYTLQLDFPVSHLLAALAVAFSMAPANGMLQRFANRLFINMTRVTVSTLQRASDLLNSIRTLDELMVKFGTFASDAVGTDRVNLFVKTDDYFKLTYPEELEKSDPIISGTSAIADYFKHSDKPLSLDSLKRRRERPERRAIMEQLNAYSAELAIAIRSKSEVTGIMLLGRKLSGRIYNAEEADALQILGRQLGTAIDNAEMYTETQNSKIYNDMLLDNMVGGVVAVSTTRQITVYNAEAQRILGSKSIHMIGQPISALPEDLARLLDEALTRKAGARDLDYFLPADLPEGEIPIRVSSAIFHGHDGSELGALLIINDLTAIRKLEGQLRMNDRLASIGTLSAGMAHEIKNPLVSIKTFAQLLPERYQDDDFRNTFSQIIDDEITRIDSIVNQLLSFARPTKPALQPMVLWEVINKTTILVQQQLKTLAVNLEMDIHAKNDQILGDKDQLEQVFLNFILNGIDSMTGGGTLVVRTEALREATHWQGSSETAKMIRVSISDTGCGIPKANIPHVFDPFFTTKSKGTGLGLSVAHGIIEEHHAVVEIESEIDKGTTFHITFPVVMKEATV